MQKRVILTLLTVSFALATVNTFAVAPTIRDWPDIIIGDIESVTPSVTAGNVFVFPNAFDVREFFVTDDQPEITSETVKWSFYQAVVNPVSPNGSHEIRINNTPSLTGTDGPLGSDSDPIQPPTTHQITANNSDPGDSQNPAYVPSQLEDSNEFTLTFRDRSLSPISGPNVEPGVVGLVSTSVLSVFASDNSVSTTIEVIVTTVNDGTDTLTGGIILTQEGDPFDFSTGALNWTSTVVGGATAAQNASGLCITVAGVIAQTGVWASPPMTTTGVNTGVIADPVIELVNGKVYRARMDISTTQSDPGEIPLVIVAYSSFAWGGNAFFVDSTGTGGGAEGFDRVLGIDVADIWITPVPVRVPAWQTEAFSPGEDTRNDARMDFVVPNVNPSIVFSADNGTLCLATLEIASGDVDDLNGPAVLGPEVPTAAGGWQIASIVVSTLAGDNTLPKSATFVPAGARFVVAPVSGTSDGAGNPGAGVGVLSTQGTGDTDPQAYPVPWNSQVLLDAQVTIESESGGTDPVDAILLTWLAPSAEIGGGQFVTNGAPGGSFDEIGVPTLGEDRVFTGLLFTHNVTTLTGVHPGFRFEAVGVNRFDINGAGSGADPYVVKQVVVRENEVPN